MDKQLSMEREAHQATQQEKDAAAAALAKLQAQLSLESQAHLSVTEAAKEVCIQKSSPCDICKKSENT